METTQQEAKKSVVSMSNYRLDKKHNQEIIAKNEERTSSLNLRPLNNSILEYYTAESGTYAIQRDRYGEEYTKHLSRSQIIFLSIIETRNDKGKVLRYVNMLLDIGNSSSKITQLLSSLNNLSKKTEDTEAYHDAGGDTGKALSTGILYNVVLDAWKLGLLEQKTGYMLPGWHGTVHVRPGDELCTSYDTYEQKKGTYQAWLAGVNPLIDGNPIPQMILSFYAGSYLRGLSGFSVEGSNIIALTTEETSTGKTTLMRIGQSFDRPAIVIPSASSTLAAMENVFVEHNGGHVSFDEIHSLIARERNPIVRLMDYCNGGGRNKMNDGAASSKDWNVTMFMSGNTSLTALADNSEQREPFNARIFEIDFSKKNIAQKDRIYKQNDAHIFLQNASTAINENYGHVYERLINLIINNHEILSEGFKGYLAEAYELYKDVVGKTIENETEQVSIDGDFTRKAKSCALAAVGSLMLSKIGLAVDTDSVEIELNKLLMKEIKRKVDDFESDKEKVHAELSAFISVLLKEHIRVDGYLALSDDSTRNGLRNGIQAEAFEKQKEDAERHNRTDVKRLYAIIEQKDLMDEAMNFNGKIWINTQKSAIDSYKFMNLPDINALAERAKKAGMLISDDKNCRTKIQKKPFGWCYCFNLSV